MAIGRPETSARRAARGASEPDGGTRSSGVSVTAVKLLVAGGFGVGKTTMVGSISEITPLRTEEVLTELSVGVDDLKGVERKTTTTVALDFGRITLSPHLVLYLFGTPGQDRVVPILMCDVRRRQSSKELLIALTEHVLERAAVSMG